MISSPSPPRRDPQPPLPDPDDQREAAPPQAAAASTLDAPAGFNLAEGWPYQCVHHDDAPAWAACSVCDALLCRRCRLLEPETRLALCVRCARSQGHQRVLLDGQEVTLTGIGAGATLSPLEPRRVADYGRALKGLFVKPTAFFTQMGRRVGLKSALMFGVGVASLCFLAALALTIQIEAPKPTLLTMMEARGWQGSALFAALLFITPCVGLIQVLLFSGVVHALLGLLGVKPGPWRATAKLTAYALAGQALLLIPSPELAALSARLMTLWLLLIGTRVVHETTFFKAAIAVAVPTLLPLGPGFAMMLITSATSGG